MKPVVMLVDLDGTLAEYHNWDGTIGAPVPEMLERVKSWLGAGYVVRIFTARVGALHLDEATGDEIAEATFQYALICEWCREYIGQELAITAVKTFDVSEVWDDRAVRVEKNTGRSEIHESHQLLDQAAVVGGVSLPDRLAMFIDRHVATCQELSLAEDELYRLAHHDLLGQLDLSLSATSKGENVVVQISTAYRTLSRNDALSLAAMLIRAAKKIAQ